MTAPIELRIDAAWVSEDAVRLRWVVPDGAWVRRGQVLCEIEAAKTLGDMVSPVDGILRQHVMSGSVGDVVLVGEVVPAPSGPAVAPAGNPSILIPTLRKQAEMRALEGGRAGLPSTVVSQFAIGDLADRLRDDGLSLTALVTYVTARALTRHRLFNARYTTEAVVLQNEIRIGVALDVEPHGLRVPVVERADTRSLEEIAGELQTLLYRYMTNTIPAGALRGPTFTVTDLTSFGAAWSVPLLVADQAAILAMGLRPTDSGDDFSLALTFDHRVASGREAATFVRDLRNGILDHRAARSDGDVRCDSCGRTPADLPADRAYLMRVIAEGRTVDRCPECLQLGRG